MRMQIYKNSFILITFYQKKIYKPIGEKKGLINITIKDNEEREKIKDI